VRIETRSARRILPMARVTESSVLVAAHQHPEGFEGEPGDVAAGFDGVRPEGFEREGLPVPAVRRPPGSRLDRSTRLRGCGTCSY
jgi:hypothetical protein